MKTWNKLGPSIKAKLNGMKIERDRLPLIVAKTASNFFAYNFVRGGFLDSSTVEKWPKRKNNKDKRGVLIGKGSGNKLSRSIKTVSLSRRLVIVGTATKYASIHNYGLEGRAFGKYAFTMPKRKFIGNSKKLEKKLLDLINNRIRLIFS